MSIISLIPQNFGTLYDTIPDIQGFAVRITTSDPLTLPLKNQLDGGRKVSGFIVLDKKGFGDIYLNPIDTENFEMVRSTNVEMLIGVF